MVKIKGPFDIGSSLFNFVDYTYVSYKNLITLFSIILLEVRLIILVRLITYNMDTFDFMLHFDFDTFRILNVPKIDMFIFKCTISGNEELVKLIFQVKS